MNDNKIDYNVVAAQPEKAKSMKSQMLKYFGIIASVSFGALLLALILTVVLTNKKIKEDSSTALEDQIEDQAHATLVEAGNYVTQFLNMYEESVVTSVSKSATDTFRSDYCLSLTEPSYFDYNGDYLAPPLTQDSRQIEPVSMTHSSYYVTDSYPEDIGNFGATIENILNRTTHLDTLFRHVYDTNLDLVGVYVGFHASSSNSFFRHYPGMEIDDARTYDPVLRPWYTEAEASSPNAVFTSPYSDAFGKGWMITGSRVIQDESGSVIGVVGADVLIASLNAVLDAIKFLEAGKLSLFDTTGQVVSDPEWDSVAQQSAAIFTYADLTSPAISDSSWNQISSAAINEKITVTIGEYNAYTYHLPAYNGQYYLVVFVKESEVLEPLEEPVKDLEEANESISIMLVLITLAVFSVLMACVLTIINVILKTFHHMERNVDALLSNVGCPEKNLADGMVDVAHVHIEELQRMNSNMNTVISNLRQSRDQQGGLTTNPAYEQASFFNDLVPFAHVEMTRMPVAYAVPQTSAPPPIDKSLPTI